MKNFLTNEDNLFFNPIATEDILIICKGNTCRSIICQSILMKKRKHSNIFSAGTNVCQTNIEKETINLLKNKNIKISKKETESISKFKDKSFDKIIILDKNIDKNNLPEYGELIVYHITDPYKENEKIYLNVFNEIETFLKTIS